MIRCTAVVTLLALTRVLVAQEPEDEQAGALADLQTFTVWLDEYRAGAVRMMKDLQIDEVALARADAQMGAVARWNNLIAAAADNHCEDMAQVGQLNHTGSDGSNAGTRLERVGYTWQQYGENIASGFTSSSEVLRAWISSPGHCRNLMGANFTEMGLARKDHFWTQVFARPR